MNEDQLREVMSRDPDWVGVASGEPAPQGSKSVTRKGIMFEQNKRTRPWRSEMVDAFSLTAPPAALDGPLLVWSQFTLTRPPSVRRLFPTVKPDGDKLERNLNDALTQAGVIVDDARIVVAVRRKVYARSEGGAGVVVRIWQLG